MPVYLLNHPPSGIGVRRPVWADDIEQAVAVTIPLFVEDQVSVLPRDSRDFVIEALERELARWQLRMPKQGVLEYDWEFLSTWDLDG